MIGYKLKRTFVLGVRSLAMHKLRSTLTALGIIFGVSSVISMLSIGEGASFEAQEEIKKLGSENIILKSKKPADDAGSGYDMKELTSYGLTWQDYGRLDATFPTIRNLVPVRIVPVEGRYRRSTLDLEVARCAPARPRSPTGPGCV